MDQDIRIGHVGRGILLLIVVLAIGTAGFMVLENYSFLDAVYMTVITVSTVGYGEVRKLDATGHVFVILLIAMGIMVVGYTLTTLGRAVVEGSLQRIVGRRRMMREISGLRGHVIVCGHGRVGRTICEELATAGVPFVVVDRDPERAEALERKGYRVVVGDATEDEILQTAGILRARGLITVASRDVDNLYITLSARDMCAEQNPGLLIISRASDTRELRKIRSAGADQVISPYSIGGVRIAQAMLRPAVYEVLDLLTRSGELELNLEDITLGENCRFAGKALRDTDIRSHFNLIIIGVRKPGGELVFNPGPEHVLEAGDEIVILGSRDQLDRFVASVR
ncbi:NAD(P)H-binding protein [bacterium]|nr:NAD(P)H-binding protein [bacterium]